MVSCMHISGVGYEFAILTFPLHLGPLVPRTDVTARVEHTRSKVIIIEAKVVIANASETTAVVSWDVGLSVERVGCPVRLIGLLKKSV